MRIEVFSLCDAATTDGGKLNILGIFDTIWAAELPVIHPQCAIALRVRFERIERGEHKITVLFADMDGKQVMPQGQGVININFQDEQGSGVVNLIFNIQGLRLEKLGEYSIDLAIDGQQHESLTLFLKKRA